MNIVVMNPDNDFIYEAVRNLKRLTNLYIDIDKEASKPDYGVIIDINNKQFLVETKSAVRTSNQGLIFAQLKDIKNLSDNPIILIADYISKEAAVELQKRGLNYIDTAGMLL